MITKKMCGIFAVAISLFGISAISAQESNDSFYCTGSIYRNDLAYAIEEFARFIQCEDYPSLQLAGQWNANDSVWQWRGGKGKGCEVHYKLSKVLDEKNDLNQEDPPGKKNGNNGNRGAANDLRDYDDISAFDQLDYFIETIKVDAKVRSDDHALFDDDGKEVYDDNDDAVTHTMADHQQFADDFVAEAEELQKCIGKLLD